MFTEIFSCGYKRHKIARVSCDLYSTRSTMLCATVLLCLVASAMCTHSLSIPDPADPTDNTIDADSINDELIDDSIDKVIDGSVNDTLS